MHTQVGISTVAPLVIYIFNWKQPKMSTTRGMLKYILVCPNFEVVQSHDKNMGDPYALIQKMLITGCFKSWLQDNTQSMVPCLKNKIPTLTRYVCVCVFSGIYTHRRRAGSL